jgi:hypothetical protein
MPLLVVCRTIITQGNASEAPASALVPMRPRKNPSNVITPANASSVRMFGAARRNNVGRIGPSSNSSVRAAAAEEEAVFPGADDGAEIGPLRSLIARLFGKPWPAKARSSPAATLPVCLQARPVGGLPEPAKAH